jgi:branched-chain amino acid transport system ATP-binding protein
MPEAMLDVRELDAYYGPIQALRQVSVRVEKGRFVSIIGANGAGKSTFLKTIVGLVKSQCGRIMVDGKDITRFPAHKIIKQGVALVLERRQLFGPLSVIDNLLLGTYRFSGKEGESQFQASLDEVFNLFGVLRERSGQKAGTLSGGEQQMVAIGRALMARPRLLLLDEPSLGLAPLFVSEIFRTLTELNDEGITMVLVEQNARLALEISDYGYVLDTGRVATQGPAMELLDNERVKTAYLGKRKGSVG